MRTKNELYQEALRTVARRRQTARAKAEDARAEAEAAVPGLRHAEEEVRVRGIRCALAGAAGKDRTDAAAALLTRSHRTSSALWLSCKSQSVQKTTVLPLFPAGRTVVFFLYRNFQK